MERCRTSGIVEMEMGWRLRPQQTLQRPERRLDERLDGVWGELCGGGKMRQHGVKSNLQV
jgi:hypothetical protein